MSFTLDNPFQYFNHPNNSNPVGLGKLYIGLPDTNPTLPANQAAVSTVQSDGSELAIEQPIQLTAGGIPSRNGTPVQLKINAETVSVQINDQNNGFLYYTARWSPSISYAEISSSNSTALIGGVQAGNLSRRTLGTWVTDYRHLVVGDDWSAAFQAAANAAGIYSTINVPAGDYVVGNVDLFMCSLVGVGSLSLIKKKAGSSFCIRYNNTGNWEYGQIAHLSFDGVTPYNGDGVIFGAPSGSQLTPGRLDFVDVVFKNFDKPIHKPFGNIGNSYTRCTFANSNFCVYAVADAAGMHVGNDVFDRCHFGNGINLACLYYDNRNFDGFGQLVVRDCIAEGNDGAGIILRNTNTAYGGIVFDNLWLEANTQNRNIVIDGNPWSTADYIFDNAQGVVIENGYVKSYRLFNSSNLLLENCRVDPLSGTYVREKSLNSSIQSENQTSVAQYNDAFIFTQTARAYNAFSSSPNSQNSVYSMQGNGSKVFHYDGYKSLPFDGTTPYTLTGNVIISSTQVNQGNLYQQCAKFTIPANEIFPIDSYMIPLGKWIVWSVSAKATGTVLMLPDGNNTVIRPCEMQQNWGNYKSCFFASQSINLTAFVSGGVSGGDFYIREMQWVAFDSKQEAFAFLNSNLYVAP